LNTGMNQKINPLRKDKRLFALTQIHA